jgi:cytochrome c biogenesis protein CcmG/thiol:disulfide interchange protein DsbE
VATNTASDAIPSLPPSTAAPSARRTQILLGLGVALAIVAGAWFVTGGSAGLGSLGSGGINQRLLPKVGETAPDFATQDLLGQTVRLSDYRGQPVWLMFWGSWCPPCRAEFPDIQRAFERVRPEGIAMLGVSLREPTLDAAQYAATNDATFRVLTDPDEQDTGAAYPIYNFPTHIFIDADGVIRLIILEDMSEEQAVGEARAVLAGR